MEISDLSLNDNPTRDIHTLHRSDPRRTGVLLRRYDTTHLVADGRGRPLGMVITGGNVNDTTMMTAVLENIHVARAGKGRPRTRGIAATIPERDDQIAHRRKKPGRPIDFSDQQRERYKGRNVVERCFNRLKQWHGIAMRLDKLARNYRTATCLAATLIWIKTDLINTA